MIKEKLHLWTVITGVLASIALMAIAVAILSFIRDPIFTQPRVELENGGRVYITESRTHEIFLEDSAPPTLGVYVFIFTNTETQEIIASHAPNRTVTYSMNTLVINGEIVRGTWGRLVALVDLEVGSYIITYHPWEGSGTFVWGVDMFDSVLRHAVRMSVPIIVFTAALIAFLFLRVKRRELMRAVK